MSEATCAVLTSIFPIVLLTVVLERRTIHVNIRRMKWFRIVTMVTVVASTVGIPLMVVGVQLEGLDWRWAWVGWFSFAIAIAGLAFSLVAAAATSEVVEDGEVAAEA